MNELEQALRNVARLRRSVMQAEDWVAVRRARVEITPEWLDYETAQKVATDAKNELSEAESAARTAILAEYERTHKKTPAKGAGVRVLRKASYILADALAWCRASAPALLSPPLASS